MVACRSSLWAASRTVLLAALVLLVWPPRASAGTSLSPAWNKRDNPLPPSADEGILSGYMCRCTCFGTNSAVVPLPHPSKIGGGNACSACTKQFCLGLELEMCQGAQAGSADQDTGTGFEGDVWARCFQKDSDKDYAVVTFYVVAIACLLAWAFIRPYMTSWVQIYYDEGPLGVLDALRKASRSRRVR